MFAFLRGAVAFKAVDSIALDVNGVGYNILVPDGVHRRLSPNQDATLITYCHIREDTFLIFGFLKEEEKTLFTQLLSISGVGPKVALAVMSALSLPDFARAILENDIVPITRAQGVGKKMAQRIVLEMKTKMGQDPELNALLGEPKHAEGEAPDDVYEAMLSLGCTPQEARKAVAHARKELGDATDQDLVRAALRSLARA